jgi:hypothetical protein
MYTFLLSIRNELTPLIVKNKLIGKINIGKIISKLGVQGPLLKLSIFLTNPTIVSIATLKSIVLRSFISIFNLFMHQILRGYAFKFLIILPLSKTIICPKLKFEFKSKHICHFHDFQ